MDHTSSELSTSSREDARWPPIFTLLSRYLFVLGLALCIVYVLWLPPARLRDELRYKGPALTETSAAFQAMAAEHQTVRSEILERIKFEDNWFNYKFLVLGALIGTTLGLAGASRRLRLQFQGLDDFIRSREFMMVLAVAVAVSLTIDIQVRRNVLVIHQLGSWIATQFEPATIPGANRACPCNPSSAATAPPPLGWEMFLRYETDENGPQTGKGAGMHVDVIYALLFWPAIHSSTVLCLVAYLIAFGHRRCHHGDEERGIDRVLFWMVCGVTVTFAVMSRVLPSVFEMRPVPFMPELKTVPHVGAAMAGGAASMLALFVVVFPCRRRQNSPPGVAEVPSPTIQEAPPISAPRAEGTGDGSRSA